jgi:septal ring factor EnvC (AmiA/AmiB activator)
MEYLINLVGNYSIGWGITIIAALVFLVLCYRKVESYFSDKAIHEKEKNEQFKKVMDQVNMYPSWHQQSIEIQQQFNKSIAELKEGMDQHQKQLEKIEEEEKEIFSAEFKEEISKLMPFSPVFINEIV